MEAGALGTGTRGAWCLPGGEVVHSGAPESQCVYGICFLPEGPVSALTLQNRQHKPRHHKSSRADKEPQFLERGFPRVNTALQGNLQLTGMNYEGKWRDQRQGSSTAADIPLPKKTSPPPWRNSVSGLVLE
jgi:hypothetical protein